MWVCVCVCVCVSSSSHNTLITVFLDTLSHSTFIFIIYHSWKVFWCWCKSLHIGFDRRTLINSSSLLIQQFHECLLILMFWEMRGKWLYTRCFIGCCSQASFQIVRCIFVLFLSRFFLRCFVSIHVVLLYISKYTATHWKNFHFISWKNDTHRDRRTHARTHARMHIYIYIERERERENSMRFN